MERASTKFKALINALCTAPVLEFPNLNIPFNICTDAPKYGIGGFLWHLIDDMERPNAYVSRTLKDYERRYSVYEKEALAIKFCIRSFKKYIYGVKFRIYTDHKPLIAFRKAEINPRVYRWRVELAEYNYEILYRPGKYNTVADALSRNPVKRAFIGILMRAQKAKIFKKI